MTFIRNELFNHIEELAREEEERQYLKDLAGEFDNDDEEAPKLKRIYRQTDLIDDLVDDLDIITKVGVSFQNDVDPNNPFLSKTALESLNVITGIISRRTGINFNSESKRIATEAYVNDYVSNKISQVVVLESINGVVGKVYDYIVKAMKQLWVWARDFLKSELSANANIKRNLESLLKRLRKMKDWKVKPGVDIPSSSLVTKSFAVGTNILNANTTSTLSDNLSTFVKMLDDDLVNVNKYLFRATTITNKNYADITTNSAGAKDGIGGLVELFGEYSGGDLKLAGGLYTKVTGEGDKMKTIAVAKAEPYDLASPVVVTGTKEDSIKVVLSGLEINVCVKDLGENISPLEKHTEAFINNFQKQAKTFDEADAKEFSEFAKQITSTVRSIARATAQIIKTGNTTSKACGAFVMLQLNN